VLDFWGDNIVHFPVFSAIAIGWALHAHSVWPLVVGGVAVASAAGTAALMFKRFVEDRATTGTWAARLIVAMSHRDFIYIVVLLSAFGRVHWFSSRRPSARHSSSPWPWCSSAAMAAFLDAPGRTRCQFAQYQGWAEKKYRNLIQGGISRCGNGARRLEQLLIGGVYAHGSYADIDGQPASWIGSSGRPPCTASSSSSTTR
jgi:hypothetical protein